jgi:DNA-binding MarR family transcriptional regulator
VIDESEPEAAARLRIVVGRLARSLRRTRAGANLTSTETTVLGSAVRSGPVGLSRLADEEGMNPTMVSRVVRHLEEVGLVVRRPDPADGRAGFIEPTAAGRRLDGRIRTERTDALNQVVDRLEPAERRSLAEALPVLERIAKDLQTRRS